jgi:hypothetical protein
MRRAAAGVAVTPVLHWCGRVPVAPMHPGRVGSGGSMCSVETVPAFALIVPMGAPREPRISRFDNLISDPGLLAVSQARSALMLCVRATLSHATGARPY